MSSSDWWVRMRIDLAEEVEVLALAGILELSPDAVVGKLLRVWGWAKRALHDGSAPGATALFLDAKVGHPGFAAAMERVGWLTISEEGIEIPEFEKHLSKVSDHKADKAERVRRSRARVAHEALHGCSAKGAKREEKRRINKPLPLSGEWRADFENFWNAYPKRANRPACEREWCSLAFSAEAVQTILAAIERQKQSAEWKRDGGRWIPTPLRYLRGRRWEDSCDFAPTPKPTETPEQRAARIQAERERRKAEERNRVSPEVARSKLRGAIQPPKTPPQTHANDPSADESTGEGQDAV